MKATAVLKALRSDPVVAMLARGTQGASMALAAVLVIVQMTPVDQGFFFAFISLGILLQLCDFGLSPASLQAASHLLATGASADLGALASRALWINNRVTFVFTVAVALLGCVMFSNAKEGTTGWAAPWTAFVIGVGFNHLTAPWTFFVEGGVSVGRAWRFRLLQETAAGTALVAAMIAGFGLWSLAIYYWIRGLAAVVWLWRSTIVIHFASDHMMSMRRWSTDIWPFQWRIGIGTISSFLVFQSFGPILFSFRGASEAGRFSLSLSVMNAIVIVTTAWPVSQAAHFGLMLSRRETERMSRHWTTLVVRSTAFATFGVGVTIAGFLVFRAWYPDLMGRFAGGAATAFLASTAIAHHLIACFTVVVRSEQRDPFLVLGLTSGIVTVAGMTLVAIHFSLDFVALAYLVCTTASVPIAYEIYRRFAKRRMAAVSEGRVLH